MKPSEAEIRAAEGETVPDVIAPDLDVLFCGINPGLYTAAVGYHFAHPSNRFWRALHESGFTERRLDAPEQRALLARGYGITNVVARATAAAADLRPEEFIEGGRELEAKVKRYRPRWLAVLGITAYRTAFGRRGADVGAQRQSIGGARVWVLPNPSGLNAHYPPRRLARVFAELRDALEA